MYLESIHKYEKEKVEGKKIKRAGKNEKEKSKQETPEQNMNRYLFFVFILIFHIFTYYLIQ